MLGRGSASIIDKHGTILTNNHVIDDGAGQPSSAFSVCVTTDLSRKPECHYTASLIARDADKDLALLRIDPLDINGNPVSYHEFPVLQIDYTYTPKIEDQISAVGYPWIGAETMSQTKGTVAGSIQYNDLTYIKTDTIIAGGNSGGPLIHDGKIVGVTTFTIGNMFDPSLGYGVLVADVQEFIE
jgi:S1-C subfamily serine protease